MSQFNFVEGSDKVESGADLESFSLIEEPKELNILPEFLEEFYANEEETLEKQESESETK